MNQLSEEEKIRQLFHELREEDHQRAPSFANTLEAVRSKTVADRPRPLLWHMAIAAASIIMIVGLAFIIRQYSARQNVNPPMDEPITRLPYREIEPPKAEALPAPIIKTIAPRKIARRKSRPAQPDSMLISRWQSPTDFLLNTWGADLIKGVPRITDSTLNFKSIPEKN